MRRPDLGFCLRHDRSDGSFTLAATQRALNLSVHEPGGPMRRPRSGLLASADRSDGSFTLAPPLLQTLAGGALADGAHALHLKATDKAGKSRASTCLLSSTRKSRLRHLISGRLLTAKTRVTMPPR